jgi:hypothetical protein
MIADQLELRAVLEPLAQTEKGADDDQRGERGG